MPRLLITVSAALAAFLGGAMPLAANAQAHEHGVGHLDVAVEGGRVELQLEAPGDNIVGFEHAPSTARERTVARDAEQRLRNGAALFSFSAAARCTLRSANVQALAAAGDPEGHELELDDHEGGEAHAEWTANYVFICASPAALAAIEAAGLFRTFPNTRELRVQLIGAAGQIGGTLTRKTTHLALPGK